MNHSPPSDLPSVAADQVLPAQLGPYRVEHQVGRGGAGQVYRAWDTRLERRVALKYLFLKPAEPTADHTDTAASAEQTNTLLREARMIATLNHPHIMQIYDVLHHNRHPVLVLEWIDGVNLAQLQGQRALPPLQVYHYTQQILQGLAAAHRLGIVHRDFKSENIMVNSEGRVKILDFGLAALKHTPANRQHTAGTCRCISPEQLRGEVVDSRTDLFALGVLLYEMLSGHSPFLRKTVCDTLEAVQHSEPPRLDQLDSSIPPGLAIWVQQLLAKSPQQRPASAELCALELETLRESITRRGHQPQPLTEDQLTLAPGAISSATRTLNTGSSHPAHTTAAAGLTAPTTTAGPDSPRRKRRIGIRAVLLIGALSAAVLWQISRLESPSPTTDPLHVLLTIPQIYGIASTEQEATLSAALSLAIRQELENRQGLALISGEIIEHNDIVNGTDFNLLSGADEMLTSSLVCAGNTCNIHIERFDQEQRRLWSRNFTAPPEAPLIYRTTQVNLQEAYQQLPRLRQLNASISATDLDRLLWLQGEFERNEMQHLNSEEMLQQVGDLLQRSPTLEEAQLLRSRILLYRYHQQGGANDLQQARAALENISITPGSQQVLFEVAIAQNDLAAAQQALDEYSRLQPGSATILAMRSRLAERQGDTQRALVLMHEAAERQPSWRHWFRAAEIAYRQGENELAKSDLQQLLLLIPEHYAGLSLLAEIELQTGRLQAAETLYSRLVMRSPQLTELSNLGTVYLFLGRYQEAAETLQHALQLASDNPYLRLNLGDALALAEQQVQADEHYRWVTENINANDHDRNLLAVLAQAQAHLGQQTPARHSVEQLLSDNHHPPQALYSAAIVYALLGDITQRDRYRKQAEEAGIDTIWFNLPWFD